MTHHATRSTNHVNLSILKWLGEICAALGSESTQTTCNFDREFCPANIMDSERNLINAE